MDKVKLIGMFEIILIILSGFAFSYILGQTNSLSQYLPVANKESKAISWIRDKILNYLSGGIVSAQSSIQTCLTNLNGTYCQEYPSEICNSQCTSQCFPGRRTEFSSCQLGTCYDSTNGLCNSGTPRSSCEAQQGEWFEQTPAQCNRECCLINPDGQGGASQAQFSTQQQCNYIGQTLGAPVSWVGVSGELECLSKITSKKEGACVLDLDPNLNKYNCKFDTEASCIISGGTFYEDQLCTNPQLNTKCEITQNTKCLDERDGVYFVDSCGNPANIYDSTKLNDINYWENVVPLEQSCSLNNNQQRCGNCDYLSGSICGNPQNGVDKKPLYGQYVCKDLSCIDENGVRREHGSSWCAFDGRIGVDGADGSNEERSVDVPGSRHYKVSCFEGEIIKSPCPEYRNGVCVEEGPDSNGITTADCRVNTGLLCLNYNKDQESLAKCEQSPDCFLKHVGVDRFEFDVCVPKYPAGFELGNEIQSDSKSICAYATQTCTYYEKKSIDGRWTCKINCGCKDAQFAETMNNLCISLGDCGGQVNLAGEFSKNYVTKGNKAPVVSQSYIDGLKKYITPLSGQRVSNYNSNQIAELFGIDSSQITPDNLGEMISQFGLGAAGLANLVTIESTIWAGFSTSLSGAAVGAGIGLIVGTAFGLEGDDMTTAVIIGAAAGVAASLGLFGEALAAAAVSPVTLIIVAIIIIILSVAGIGKYRERHVTFECLPWQPPVGGDNCDECGKDGLGCTEYKCQSLGKTCGFLNKGTSNEVCVNLAPGDASPPEINLNASSLSEGFSYEMRSNNRIVIKDDSASDGCLKEYTPVNFGISLNEPGQCKIAFERTSDYESMDGEYFDSSGNAYVLNHDENIAMPTLDTLGVSGIDPARRGNYDLYIRCQDGSGHFNSDEYIVDFCVAPANDVTPPEITKFVPESPGYVGLNSTQFDLRFYTNEPAQCKISDQDESYESMQNAVTCYNEIDQSTIYGWLCQTRFNLTEGNNDYYLRCADQPWLGEDISGTSTTLETGRNSNSESTIYRIQRTTTPLKINSINIANNTIYSGTQFTSVNLIVSTTGGIEDGKAFCKYSLNGGSLIDFFETSLNTHKQTWTALVAGRHHVNIECFDRAGNVANSNAEFEIVVDNIGPQITRVYNSGNSLRVITNEDSMCEYSVSSCSFEFGTGTQLNGLSKIHSMSYNKGISYKIKCKDSLENIGTCLTVSAGY